jgi:hypothetical protein
VVLQEQLPIALYIGGRGHLVIRQQRDWHQDEDTLVLIAPQNIMRFVERLLEVAGVPSLGRGA